jgi:hypothetical protein
MSDFWNLSDGSDLKDEENNGAFDAGGGKIEVIPEGTQVLAAIDEAKWDRTTDGDKFINVRWTVLQPEELANRKIFQKLWVDDYEPAALKKGEDKAKAKKDKAKRMLMAIDANAGGKLAAKGVMPSDIDLTSSLTMKPMVVKVMVWQQTDRTTGALIEGNWVGAVAPKNSERTSPEELAKLQASQAKASAGRGPMGQKHALDDEIPFAPCMI